MACICYGFFIMLGTVGWRASLMFVRHIYKVMLCHEALTCSARPSLAFTGC